MPGQVPISSIISKSEVGSCLETLRLKQATGRAEVLELFGQLVTHLWDDLLDGCAAGHVVRGRVDCGSAELRDPLACQRIEACDALDFLSPELDADRLLLVCREDLHGVTANAKGAALEQVIVAFVLDIYGVHQESLGATARSPCSTWSMSSR